MAFGSKFRGSSRDFGLTSNLTLPVATNVHPAGGFMPEEGRRNKRKTHARFTIDQVSEPAVKEGKVKRSGWLHRFRGIFRKSSSKERSPYAVNPLMLAENNPRKVVQRSESDPEVHPLKRGSPELYNGKAAKQQTDATTKSSRKIKAQSTAFEHISSTDKSKNLDPVSNVHLVLKPRHSRGGIYKVILQQGEEADGLGLHLSGGVPPVSVVYVSPGGQAEQAGVKIGDIVLEVNGLNCQKKVEIAKLKKMKMIVQELPMENPDEQDDMAWRERQDNFESDTSKTKITNLDSSEEEEAYVKPAPAKVTSKKRKNGKHIHKKPGLELGEPLATSSPFKEDTVKAAPIKVTTKKGENGKHIHKKPGLELGEPLATSSPFKEDTVKAAPIKVTTKKGENGKHIHKKPGLELGEPLAPFKEDTVKAAPIKVTTKKGENGKHIHKKPGLELGEPLATSSPLKEDTVKTESKPRKKKKSSSSQIVSKRNSNIIEEDGKKKTNKKSTKKSSSSVPKSTLTEESLPKESSERKNTSSTTIDVVQTDKVEKTPENDALHRKMNGKEVNGKQEEQEIAHVEEVDSPLERNDRNRRSSSPKSRYHMDDIELPESDKVTLGIIKKKKGDSSSKGKDRGGGKGKKKSKSKEKKELKKVKSKEISSEPTDEHMASSSPAAISGSIESSDTLTFVSPTKKKSKKRRRSSQETIKAEDVIESKKSLLEQRRKSADHGIPFDSSKKPMVSHSTSYSSLQEENRKIFCEELRQASKSQYDIANDTDQISKANIKVKPSGVIKEKSPTRPSIFHQLQSSPEPQEPEVSISSGAIEDNLLDSDFKVKKSGLIVGKKTTSATRPSILEEDQTAKTSPKDIQPGEMKYNKTVNEEIDMDISVIPQISPTLGLVAGRDRLSTNNRSLTKRRPPSLRKSIFPDSNLSQERGDMQTVPAIGGQGTTRTTAAIKLFESKQRPQDSSSKLYSRSIEKPVKTLAIAQDAQKKPPKEDSRTKAHTTVTDEVDGSRPSWAALTQGRQDQTSMIKKKDPLVVTVNSTVTVEKSITFNRDKSLPKMGHVAERLAMFQKQ